jgi:hypothetical protein
MEAIRKIQTERERARCLARLGGSEPQLERGYPVGRRIRTQDNEQDKHSECFQVLTHLPRLRARFFRARF